jgi:hypothetical protein
VTYGFIAASCQSLFTLFRHFRQDWAFVQEDSSITTPKYHITQNNDNSKESYPSSFDALQSSNWASLEKMRPYGSSDPEPTNWDPIQDAFDWTKNRLVFLAWKGRPIPDWSSPLVNALDIEYRKRLNDKLDILERQIGKLKKDLSQKDL